MSHSSPISPDSQSGSASSLPLRADGKPPRSIIVEVYENQRWLPISKWSSTKRLPSDRPLYSNKSGSEERDLATFEPPYGYVWGSLPATPSPSVERDPHPLNKSGSAEPTDKTHKPTSPMPVQSPFDEADDYMHDVNAARSKAAQKSSQPPSGLSSSDNLAKKHQQEGEAANTDIPEIIANTWQLEVQYPTRTDKDGWRYSVDYKANFGREMTATSLVRRRRHVRTAVYVGGNGLNVDSKNTAVATKLKERDLQYHSGGVGATHLGDSFIFVSNTGGSLRATSGHGDDSEKGFESCDSDGGTHHSHHASPDAAQTPLGNGNHAHSTSSPPPPINANDKSAAAINTAAAAVPSEPLQPQKPREELHHTSIEAQRQAAVAALASMRTKEGEGSYFPKDNDCANAAADGEGFDLPTSFQTGGSTSTTKHYASYNSVGRLSTEPSFGFHVPEGPYMAVSSAGTANPPAEINQFSSTSATFVVTPPPRLADNNDILSGSAYFGASAGSSPSPSRNNREPKPDGDATYPTVYFGAAAGRANSTSAEEFDEVFRAFVAKEKDKTTL